MTALRIAVSARLARFRSFVSERRHKHSAPVLALGECLYRLD